jgi:hypothetical protein
MRFDAINEGPALTEDAVASYCAEHDLEIPAPLRRQLLDQNGGAPREEALVSIQDNEDELMSFFGIGMPDRSSELAWVAKTFQARLPVGFLAFADDPGGNLFLIETAPESKHGVWFWDHEREGEGRAALSLVAPTFDDFLAVLGLNEG